jgi:hypothetical protein
VDNLIRIQTLIRFKINPSFPFHLLFLNLSLPASPPFLFSHKVLYVSVASNVSLRRMKTTSSYGHENSIAHATRHFHDWLIADQNSLQQLQSLDSYIENFFLNFFLFRPIETHPPCSLSSAFGCPTNIVASDSLTSPFLQKRQNASIVRTVSFLISIYFCIISNI